MNEASLFISSELMTAPEHPLIENLELSMPLANGQKCDSASAQGLGLRNTLVYRSLERNCKC